MYSATRELNGFFPGSPSGAGVARYTDPVRGFLSKGEWTVTVPIFDPDGHSGSSPGVRSRLGVPGENRSGSGVNLELENGSSVLPEPWNPMPFTPGWLGVGCSGQASSPFAEDGLSSKPGGSVTVVDLTSDSASALPSSVIACGTCTSTFSPVGALAACVVGLRLIWGVNGSPWQFSTAASLDSPCKEK